MKGSVLILGTGIAGLKAGADLLQQGFKVYLLEEGSCIGGKMATLEQLFPTNEDAACALQPLTLDLLNNPNATILTSAKLISLHGESGDFTVQVESNQAGDGMVPQKMELIVGAVIVTSGPEVDNSQSLSQLGLAMDEKGYFKNDPGTVYPVLTSRDGIFRCGAVQAPKGIGESVIQACAAAAHAAALLRSARGSELEEPIEKKLFPVKVTDEPKIAVVIDQGGTDVADLLDLDELGEYTRILPGVGRVEVTPCASDGSKIEELLSTGDFNRLIVAGPSPIPNEPLFQRYAEMAGLNRYLLEMVNLRNQCARVHSSNKTEATDKAKILMRMGVTRARQLEPLEELQFIITQSCLVIGGTTSGVACAAKLAEMGIYVHVVEKGSSLENIPGNNHPLVKPLVAKLSAEDKVEVHTLSTVSDVQGCIGNFKVKLIQQGKNITVEVGAIVVATVSGIEESAEGTGLEDFLALERDEDGFYVSTQGILNPLDFTTEGVFNCGPARAVLGTEDAVVDGEAAASRVSCVLTSPLMVRPPTISSVVEENCDGCAYCIEPCPTKSITLLEFMHRGEIKKVVEVNEATCIGCGICMATCPKKGILVRHFKPEGFTEMVNAALIDSDKTPVIVSFCCNRCAYPGADAAGSAGIQYPTSIRIIRSVCSGMIHPNIIMDALTRGADGVLLCGCHPGNCRSRDGIRKAQARAESIELMLGDFGLEPERFRLELIAASEGPKFARVVEEMTKELAALGPNPYR